MNRMPLFSRNQLLSLIGTALLGTAIYATRIEPKWLGVAYIQVKLPRLPKAFHDYRIAQISDIHMGGWMTRQRLMDAVSLINTIRPDMVAITGDFVERHADPVVADLIASLSTLKPIDGTVAVMGNHDYYFGLHALQRVLNETGIIELRNAVHTIQRGASRLHFAGVDDIAEHQDSLDAVLDQLPKDGAAVLLAHEPDFADISAATGRFDLQISGHTHGGQIRIPFLGAPLLPSYGRRYPNGRYQVGDMIQYTNRGLGMIRPYVRLNARPEITVFILETAKT
jgi:predicted MPP superfamily phosphohydrolase